MKRWRFVLLGLVLMVAWRAVPRSGGCSGRCRSLPSRSSCRSSPARPRAEIAQAWVDAGVQASPLLLYEWFRWSGQARQIRAGSYEIDRNVSPRQLLLKMVRGDEALAAVAPDRGLDLSPVPRRAGARRRPEAEHRRR